MAEYKSKSSLKNFKNSIKNYISKALNIEFEDNDDLFIKKVDQSRNNLTNVTPNGGSCAKKRISFRV